MNSVFTMHGRLSRKQYIWYSMMITVVAYAFAFVLAISGGVSGGTTEAAGALGFMVCVVGIAVQVLLAVRRLHDLGKPGWHCWLLLIPFYNIYMCLVLLFTRGVEGSNEYGPDPVAA